MRKANLFQVFCILAVVFMIASCAPKAAPAATSAPVAAAPQSNAPAAPKGEPIKIGWFGPLTGDQAIWGTAESNALILMAEKTNAEGGILGRPVEIVVYDNKTDQLESVNVVKRLIKEDKVSVVVGSNSSSFTLAVVPISQENKTPQIATYATNPRVTQPEPGKLNEYIFRVCFTDPYQGKVIAQFAKEELKATKAALLYEISSDYSVGISDFFRQSWAELGGELVADEAFKSGDVDFRAQLTKIKETNPDVIVMPTLFKEAALAAKQARDLGINQTFIGGDGWPSSQLLEIGGAAVEGSYYTDHTDLNLEVVQGFKKEYKDRFGIEIETTGILGHDAFLVIKAAIEKAGSADREAIKNALTSMDPVQGLTGKIIIDPKTHDPIGKAAVVITIKDNKFQLYKMVEPMQ